MDYNRVYDAKSAKELEYLISNGVTRIVLMEDIKISESYTFDCGENGVLNNVIGEFVETSNPDEVSQDIKQLLLDYNNIKSENYAKIDKEPHFDTKCRTSLINFNIIRREKRREKREENAVALNSY